MRFCGRAVAPFVKLCSWFAHPSLTLERGTKLSQVEAFRGNVIMPNRHEESHGTMFDGHLVASETYVGGHVEALEAGVFRSDIPANFKIVPSAVQQVRSHGSTVYHTI